VSGRAIALLFTVGARCTAAPAYADDGAIAAAHHQRAMASFDVGDYDRALVEFNATYEITGAPSLLFNLGQSHRLRGDNGRALHCYRRYLALEPDASNRRDVERFIAALEQQALLPPPSLVAAPRGGRPIVLAGALASGVGVALLGVGLYLQLQADSVSDQIAALSRSNAAWRTSDQTLYDYGRDMAVTATALFVAGGALAASGVVAVAAGWRREAVRHVALLPSLHGASLVFQGSLR
jgi:tetratricopeptide (TPR) repeat protein